MMWFFAVLLVLVMGGVAMVAAGRGAPMSEAYDDRPDALVPASGDLAAGDLRRIRFSLAFRGYRMSEVDALLDRLADQLADQLVDRQADPQAHPQAHQQAEERADPPSGSTAVAADDAGPTLRGDPSQ